MKKKMLFLLGRILFFNISQSALAEKTCKNRFHLITTLWDNATSLFSIMIKINEDPSGSTFTVASPTAATGTGLPIGGGGTDLPVCGGGSRRWRWQQEVEMAAPPPTVRPERIGVTV